MTYLRTGIFICALLPACGSAAVDAGAIWGDWHVADVYCRSCSKTDRSDIGRLIRIQQTGVSEPVAGGDCAKEVGYRELPPTSVRENAKKLSPKWLGRNESVTKWIAITCRRLDFLVLALLPDGALGYVSEGELSYRLVRKQSRGAPNPTR